MTGSAVPPDVIADAVAAAGAWLRVPAGETGEDGVIAALAASATALAEAFCRRTLVARAFEETVPPEAAWRPLATAPVTAITAVAAATAQGELPLPPDAYAIDIDADGVGWVRVFDPGAVAPLVVRGTAGMAAGWAALPPPVAQGIAMLVAHLFDHREGDAAPPAAVAALWRPWRRLALMAERRA